MSPSHSARSSECTSPKSFLPFEPPYTSSIVSPTAVALCHARPLGAAPEHGSDTHSPLDTRSIETSRSRSGAPASTPP